MSRSPSFISAQEIEPVCGYLKNHAEVRELLVSGGDPLTAEDSKLAGLFRAIREARPGILIRICTRVPIAWPQRLTPETLRLFVGFKPLRMMVHINHPRELAEESRRVLADCAARGIPVHVQTVLLRGVNDNAGTLVLLFRECLDLGLSPYYLFQPDLAPGTAHFRLPLKEGLALYKELQTLISGLGLPAYAVDLPGGGSKIRLNEGSIAGETQTPAGRAYLLKAQDGKFWPYPAD
jgi:lysine 2,3-aminomutase